MGRKLPRPNEMENSNNVKNAFLFWKKAWNSEDPSSPGLEFHHDATTDLKYFQASTKLKSKSFLF